MAFPSFDKQKSETKLEQAVCGCAARRSHEKLSSTYILIICIAFALANEGGKTIFDDVLVSTNNALRFVGIPGHGFALSHKISLEK